MIRKQRRRSRAAWAALAATAIAPAVGCGTVNTTNTQRSATEQLLLTNAWDAALQKVDFRPLSGVPVFLDTTNITAVDQGWVVSSMRQSMLAQGVLLRAKPEQAQWIVEARVGAFGTDEDKWLLGIAQTTIPPTVTGMPSGTIPEISLAKRNRQRGVAKMALFAYDRSSGQMTWQSGTMMASANSKDVYVGGLGPFHNGPGLDGTDAAREGTEFMGVKLPTPAEIAKPGRSRARPAAPAAPVAAPFEPPPMAPPASAADLESFAP